MVPAVDDEASGPGDGHALIEHGLAGQPPHRQQQVRSQDQDRARPAGDLDEDELEAQAACFLSR